MELARNPEKKSRKTQKVVLFSLKIEVSKVLQMIIKLSVSKTKWTGLFVACEQALGLGFGA